MSSKKRKVSFPHMGNYFVAGKPIAELIADEVIKAPPISRQTIELGFKQSPEGVCIPFKYNLGNYIEALEAGANVLVQAGGGCRFGYYGEVQAEILRQMGYTFDFIKLTNNYSMLATARDLKKINPQLTHQKILYGLALAYRRMRCIDDLEMFIRKNVGFEKNEGEFERVNKLMLFKLNDTKTTHEVKAVKKEFAEKFRSIKIDKPATPLRVGIIGELYVLMEPFSNFQIEKELAKKGIEVHRFVTASSILHEIFNRTFLFDRHLRHHLKNARPYLKHHIGAHGTESVAIAQTLIKEKFDGIIHVKPFGCMPEVNAMSALHKLSRDFKFPIIYFSFDTQSSEIGLKTRLEAFHDMLIMKKQKQYEP